MDALREAVFSSLGTALEGRRVLDLFAGSGSYGLEAMSRGAASCTFVEQNQQAISAIELNAKAVAKAMQQELPLSITKANAFKWKGGAADLIFADPPYAILEEQDGEVLRCCKALAAPAAIIVLEAPGGYEPDLPEGLTLTRRIGRGKNQASALLFHL